MNASGVGIDIEVNGEKVTFEPLTFEDMEWLEMRMRSQAIETGRLSLSEDMPAADRHAAMQEILEYAQTIDIFRDIRKLFNPRGMTWLLWRMVRRAQPRITLNEVSVWTRDPDLMSQLNPQLQLLMGLKKTSPQTTTSQGTLT